MNFERLRELVLERAIRGELVPQNCDEDCVKEGTSEDVPFDVPASWGWVQLADLSVKRKTVDPMTIDEPNVELWSIPAYDSGAAQEICPKDIGSSKKIVLEGDVLLSKIVPHIKRAWVVTESGRNLPKLASTEWLVYGSGRLIPEFLALQFRSPYFRKKMLENISGMGSLKRANPSSLAKVFLPVPPLLEQVRIVEKIKEAFAEIDRAEKAYEELQTLAGVLRGQILQEAIQGKLVPHLAEEGVVEQIGATPEKVPFEIPEKWKWYVLDQIGEFKKGPFGSALTKSMFVPDGPNAVRVYEQRNAIEKDSQFARYFITQEYYEAKMKSFTVSAGDLIVSCAGTIGEIYQLPANAKDGIINQALMRVRLTDVMIGEYFQLVFASLIRDLCIAESGGTAIKNIPPFKVFKQFPIPVPPVQEQCRIVQKVRELMEYVDSIVDPK